jgi:hypothetical protein
MDLEKWNNNLIEKTIKAHLKHLGIKIKNDFLYKEDIAIYTEDLKDRIRLLSFLEGISIVYDNKELWRETI